jgi:hypothetical protein
MGLNSTATPIRYITGENDPFTGLAFPKTGCFPAASQLMTLDAIPLAITATTVTANTKLLRLSSDNYNINLIRAGMYIYVQGQNIAVRIKGVDTYKKTVVLDKAFPTNLAAVNVFVAKAFSNKKVQAISSGTADAILQGVDFRVDEIAVFEGGLGVAPIAYDANAANAEITFNITQ